MTNLQSPSIRPSFAVLALHVVTLTALAVTARLYSALGDKPMFFSVRQAGATELVLFVLLLSVVLPGLLVGLLWFARRINERFGQIFFLVLFAILLSIIALPVCKQVPRLPEAAACGFALVLGIVVAGLYWKLPKLRNVFTILAPIIVISPAIYVFATPTSQLVFHHSQAAAADVRSGEPVPVVMIVFDELSCTTLVDGAGHIDAALYPNFAALAAESTWFRNASSVAAETEAALPGILTGNLPLAGIHELDSHEYPNSLFTLLRSTHEYSVFEPCTAFCPAELRGLPERWTLWTRLRSLLVDAAVLDAILILPPHWPVTMPDVTGKNCNFAGTADGSEPDVYYNRREILEGFIDAIHPGGKPGLYFIHSVLPHAPWLYLPSGKQYDLNGLPPAIRDCDTFAAGAAGLDRQSKHWPLDAVVVAQAQQRYLLQVQFVDRELGRLLRHLRQIGLYDRSLIVITADHGVSFVPGQPFRGICQEIYPETLSVPLFFKLPGQKQGRVSDRNVEAVDILPTIADVVKIRLPWITRGSSALVEDAPQRPGKEACIEMQPWATWKCDARLSERDASIRRRLATFASSKTPDALYRFGPYAELIGRRIEDCRVTEQGRGRCEIFSPERLVHVDLQQDCLPLLIGGRVVMPVAGAHGIDLAVTINGTVRGVVRSFPVAGYGEAWTALLPEDALRQGANDVKVFRAIGHGSGVALEPLVP